MAESQAASLLQRASAEPTNSTPRKLLTAAAFAAAALDGPVLVGGVATEVHTGSYRPTDIDLVGHRKAKYTEVLKELGFEQDGRHWLYEFADGERLAIEVPDDTLGDFANDEPEIIDLDPGELAVISLNDLMMDRLLQATGGEPVTLEEATRLAVAGYDRIDWMSLEERAQSAADGGSLAGEALPALTSQVRRRAIRLLRQQATS